MSLTDAADQRCYYDSVALNITSRCNLRCLHCYNGSGEDPRQDMDRAALIRAADAVLSLKPFNLCLCGGEPLCCPDLIPLLEHLRGRVPQISMVTNGFALDEAWARTLAAYGVGRNFFSFFCDNNKVFLFRETIVNNNDLFGKKGGF